MKTETFSPISSLAVLSELLPKSQRLQAHNENAQWVSLWICLALIFCPFLLQMGKKHQKWDHITTMLPPHNWPSSWLQWPFKEQTLYFKQERYKGRCSFKINTSIRRLKKSFRSLFCSYLPIINKKYLYFWRYFGLRKSVECSSNM